MSIYEVLVFVALVCVGGFAYYLYRSDMRSKPPGQQAPEGKAAPDQLMFGRNPRNRPGGGENKPGS